MSKNKNRRIRRLKRIANTLPAKTPQSIKESKVKSGLIRLIISWFQRHLKGISTGTFLSLIALYYAFLPKDLEIKDQLLGKYNPFSSAVIFTNPNPYLIDNINIKININADLYMGRIGTTMENVSSNFEYLFIEIPAYKSKSIVPSFIVGEEVTEIKKGDIQVILSYDTPFLYPNISNDTILYAGVLNSEGEVIYLPK